MRTLPLISVLALSFLPACRSTSVEDEDEVGRLAAWMRGAFTSAEQATLDPDHYFDIRLYMEPMWAERPDGPWLYVEQAATSALERPYRQRVYRLVDTPEGVRSDVYELPGDPLRFAGAWRDTSVFDDMEPEALLLRDGCSIYLVSDGTAFVGATRGKGCSSSLGGASYATSEVSVEEAVLTSWDRGFDAEGTQVWGADQGPYVFLKDDALLSEEPPAAEE